MVSAEEIAAAVLFPATGEASFVIGQTLVVDGGLTVTDYPSRTLLAKVGWRLTSGGRSGDWGCQTKKAESCQFTGEALCSFGPYQAATLAPS